MAVKLVPKFTRAQIREYLEKKRKALQDAILLNLRRIGEQFVTNARNISTYKDRTGNLRSSIGYVIIKDGDQIYSNFKSTGGKDGVKAAKEIVVTAQQDFPH